MREIKDLGIKNKGTSRAYRYAEFECPICRSKVEKIKKDGAKAKSCSMKCSQGFKGERKNYKPFVIIGGYKWLYKPEHSHAKNGCYVEEHRLVIEKHIGRELRTEEVVHHLNGNKLDNTFANLIVLSNSDHSKLHAYYSTICKRGGEDGIAI